MKEINQNPERYIVDKRGFKVSASPNIKPLEFSLGEELDGLKPLLLADGIIVKVEDSYLVSQKTLDDIRESKNPHYDYRVNGIVTLPSGSATIGKTVPIIEVNVSGLKDRGDSLDLINRNAGVKSVDYLYEGEKIDGVPVNLLNQINYTLNQSSERGLDKYSIWVTNLSGDYSIDKLKIETAQGDTVLDKEKLASFLSGVNDRLGKIRKDFNLIKDIFYNGAKPTDENIAVDFNQAANPIDTDNQNHTVLFKQTETLNTETTQQQKVAEQTLAIQTELQATKDTIQQQISNQTDELARAQEGDRVAQQRLQDALRVAQQDAQNLRTILRNKKVI